MDYFNIRKVFLPINLAFDDPEVKKLDAFVLLLKKSGIGKLIKKTYKTGRPGYKTDSLFATVLYGFSFYSESLRDLERSCKYDLRYMYLMENETPSYQTFSDFINEFIKPNIDEIFHSITHQISQEIGADIHEYAFADGTKFEADCNRYKFVWKPITFHKRLTNKIIEKLREFNLQRDVEPDSLITSAVLANKITQLNAIKVDAEKEKLKAKTLKELYKTLEKILEYEEKETICGQNRNSYYKTDHDATAMCLKDDYYAGLGSSMHAAYSTQIVVSNYLITSFLVSQSRSDIKDLIDVLQVYYSHYRTFPKKLCADAGYGSNENYKFLNDNNIKSFVKFQTWQGNMSGKNPDRYKLYKEGYIKCLYGRIGHEVKGEYHRRYKNSAFFKIFNCSYCSVNNYCKFFCNEETKNKTYKIFEVRKDFTFLKQENEANLLSVEGIEMRVNRSMQVEGAYGVVKQDIQYTRLRRTGFDSVKTEIALTFLGYNIRKYFSYLSGREIKKYWMAPDNCISETFKTPRFNILQKRKKKKIKQPNQSIKDNHRYQS